MAETNDHQKPATLSVMLVDDNLVRAELVDKSLQQAGFSVLSVLPTASGLLFQIEQLQPDVIIIALESPDRDVLESLSVASAHNPTPVVMFSEQQDADFIADAIRSGVTAYQVEGISPEKVKSAIDVAIAQFRSFNELRCQLEQTRQELNDRKALARAKGLIMDKHKVSEQEAFATLRKLAMDRNQTLGETAHSIIQLLEA